jgi:hypothetical protein
MLSRQSPSQHAGDYCRYLSRCGMHTTQRKRRTPSPGRRQPDTSHIHLAGAVSDRVGAQPATIRIAGPTPANKFRWEEPRVYLGHCDTCRPPTLAAHRIWTMEATG